MHILRLLPGRRSLLLGKKARYNGDMRIALGVAVLVTFGTGTARADEPRPLGSRDAATHSDAACEGPSIVLKPPLSQRRSWKQAVGDTRKRMAELVDVDPCARLEVQQTRHTARVRARAADGRSVVRELSGPSELEPIVVALLVLPPDDQASARELLPTEDSATAAVQPAVPPQEPAKKPALRRERRDELESGAHLDDHASRASSVELGLGAAGRSTGYLSGLGAGAIVDWVLAGWLLGATVHGEQLSSGSSDAEHFSAERSASLGFLFGRRLVSRPFYLDVALEAPVFALRTSQWTSKQTTTLEHESEPGEVEAGDDDAVEHQTLAAGRERATPPNPDLRAGALVRGVVPFTGHFGATLGADAERSLGFFSAAAAAGQPAALDWNYGLSLGLFWSGG